MSVTRLTCGMLTAVGLAALIGCGGNKQQATTSPPPSAPNDYSARLNDPNVSEQEKDQIRRAQTGASKGA